MIHTKNTRYLEALENLGLNEVQASVYFATLLLGSSTVQKIAQLAEVNRSTTYTIIDSLIKMGLLIVDIRGEKRFFSATSPELLEKTLELRKQRFEKILPEFMSIYSHTMGDSFMRYVEGVEGVREIMNLLLKDIQPNDAWVFMVRASGFRNLLGAEWVDDFSERRSRARINVRGLFQEEPYAHDYQQYAGAHHVKMKILPKHIDINTSQSITPQHSLIVPLREPIIGILIDNKEVIHTHQQTFSVLWDSL